jgi:DNA polymerase
MTRDTVSLDRSSVLSLAVGLRTCLHFHQQMGIERYPLTPALRQCLHPRSGGSEPKQRVVPKPTVDTPVRPAQARPVPRRDGAAHLIKLRQDIADCRLCRLASARQGVVSGSGTAGSSLLVVGDYSCQDADFSADTLFGTAEDVLLWSMMRAIGLTPEGIYVTNAVKCCPLPTEPPGDESAQRCRAHLVREIELVRPRVLCAMGDTAARLLVGGDVSVFRLRGTFHQYRLAGETGGTLPIMVTFHPRLLLKNVELKKAAWQDLQMIQRLLQAP